MRRDQPEQIRALEKTVKELRAELKRLEAKVPKVMKSTQTEEPSEVNTESTILPQRHLGRP